MRRSRSLRLTAWEYRNGYTKYDRNVELQAAGFRIYHTGSIFVVEKKFGNIYYQRRHKCHYRLVCIAFRYLESLVYQRFQGVTSLFTTMSTPLAKHIMCQLQQRDLRFVRLGGYRHTRPAPLSKLREPDEAVKQIINTIPSELVEDYHHSSQEDSIDLMSAGYLVLSEKANKEFDEEVFFDLFLQLSLEQEDPVEPGPCTTVKQLSQVQPTSSCGLQPLNSLYGSPIGTKKQMIHSAVAVNATVDCWTGAPGCLPYKPCPKDEVIKKGKKVRTIMIESQPNVLVLRHYFETVVSADRKLSKGRGIGLSTTGGSFKVIFMRWFRVWCKYSQGGWNEFLDWLSTQQLSESDKSAWESSTNETDGLAYLIATLMSVRVEGDHRLLARALADYANPPIQIDGDCAYFAPWRIPSGSYLTAHGNTERHHLMATWVCNFFQEHGGAGKIDCCCRWCPLIADVEGFGSRLTPMELELLSSFYVMGDDFIGFAYGSHVFNRLIDLVFGTTTKDATRPVFSTPSMEEPEGAEFLKKHFYLDKTFSTWNVRTFRAPKRMLAKLYHGRAKTNRNSLIAALLSAVWETGHNRPLHNILRDLLEKVQALPHDISAVKKELLKYQRKVPQLKGVTPTYIPSFEMIANCDASLLRPLETVYWDC